MLKNYDKWWEIENKGNNTNYSLEFTFSAPFNVIYYEIAIASRKRFSRCYQLL